MRGKAIVSAVLAAIFLVISSTLCEWNPKESIKCIYTFYNMAESVFSSEDMYDQLKKSGFDKADNVESADIVFTRSDINTKDSVDISSMSYKEYGYSPIIVFLNKEYANDCENGIITKTENSSGDKIYNINTVELLDKLSNKQSITWGELLDCKENTEVRLALPSESSEAYEQVREFIRNILKKSYSTNKEVEDKLDKFYTNSYLIDITEDNVRRAMDTKSIILIAPEYCIKFMPCIRYTGDLNAAAYPLEPTTKIEFGFYYKKEKQLEDGTTIQGSEIAESFVTNLNESRLFGPVASSIGAYHNMCIRPVNKVIIGSSSYFDHSQGFVAFLDEQNDYDGLK